KGKALPARSRDRVYTSLEQMLHLRARDRRLLHRRGLSDEEIDALGYRSISSGLKAHTLNKRLTSKFGATILKSIPGFSVTESSYVEFWPSAANIKGILMFARDVNGLRHAMCLRRTDGGLPKYQLVSSGKGAASLSGEHLLHVAGPEFGFAEVYITE